MFVQIFEPLPADPLEAEAVLHVRRHLKRNLRRGHYEIADLTLLFGLEDDGSFSSLRLDPKTDVLRTAATQLAAGGAAVSFGHDERHVEQCRQWLLKRKCETKEFDPILATDLGTLLTLSRARDLARGDLPILITGETGVGKEGLARAIHELSGREGPYEAVQLAGMPADMINDELFGHVQGAFTDAKSRRDGRLKRAHRGTLLLDELGDLPMEAQMRLLRVLQERKFSQLGCDTEIEVDVRIIATTLQPLEALVDAGKFRRDLFYRVRGEHLILPPLAKRCHVFNDVVPCLLQRVRRTLKVRDLPDDRLLSPMAAEAMMMHPWPGNIRELDHVLRIATNYADGQEITLEDLPQFIVRPYLSLPLYERSLGYVSEPVFWSRSPVPEVSQRIEDVRRSLQKCPLDTASENRTEQLLEFLRAIPDPRHEHQCLIAHLRGLIRVNVSRIRLCKEKDLFVDMRGRSAHAPVREALAEACDRADGSIRQLDATLAESACEPLLHDSPWVRLAAEISSHPIVRQIDGVQMVVAGGLAALYTMKPSAAHEIAQLIKDGGLEAIFARLRESLDVEEFDDEEGMEAAAEDVKGDSSPGTIQPYIPTGPHRLWTKREWQQIVAEYNSKAEAARALKKDQRTITNALKRVGIAEQWGVRGGNA